VRPFALIADDHPASLDLARYLLEVGGFEVTCAKDGEEALSIAAARRPDVVVLDLALASIDGCEVRDRLAADPGLADVPVVAMSVYEIGDFCPGRTAADFAGYVGKPVEPATFADLVRAALPGRSQL
jgi:two-component system, cell cycle response regulator DivK